MVESAIIADSNISCLLVVPNNQAVLVYNLPTEFSTSPSLCHKILADYLFSAVNSKSGNNPPVWCDQWWQQQQFVGQDSVICQLPHTWSPVPVTTLFPLCLPSATLPFSEVCTYSLQFFLFCFGSLVVGRGRSKESCEQFLISQHSDSPRKQR